MGGPASAINFGGMNNTGDPNQDSSPPSIDYGTPFQYSAETASTPVYYYAAPGDGAVSTPGVRVKAQENYSDAFKGFRDQYANDPKGFQALQAKLYNGGFYDGVLKAGQLPNFGRFDKDTTTAINKALSESAVSGSPIEDVIDNAANNAQAQRVQPYRTNTQNITTAVKALGPQILGREVPDDVVQKIVDTLHGSEDAAAKGQTGTETAVTGDQAWYAEQLKELMPHTAKAYQTFEGLTSANLGAVNNLGANG